MRNLKNKAGLLSYLFAATILSEAAFSQTQDSSETYTFQWLALAPNAGGQDVYALKMGNDKRELGVFSNQYLFASGLPLSGVTYDLRYPICGRECWNPMFLQLGAGVSQVGPLLQVTWSVALLRSLRIDYTTQAYFGDNRLILWSYPLWLGFSVRF